MKSINKHHPDKWQRGLSLVELMVAITIAMLITAAVIGMFFNANRSYNEDDRYARMMENGRFALNQLATDLMMVDFWGEMVVPPASNVGAGNDCGIDADDPDSALLYVANNCGATLAAGSTLGIPANSNMLAIKGVHRAPDPRTPDANLDFAYLCTNRTSGTIRIDNNCPATDELAWAYLARLYYVVGDTRPNGNVIPYLCRNLAVLNGNDLDFSTVNSADQCMAEGIERLHVEFGIDTNGNGIANRYVIADINTNFDEAVSARVYLLARSANPAPAGYTDNKTYWLGQLQLGPFNDAFYRRVFSTTVLLRNPKSLIVLGATQP